MLRVVIWSRVILNSTVVSTAVLVKHATKISILNLIALSDFKFQPSRCSSNNFMKQALKNNRVCKCPLLLVKSV